MNTLKLYIKQKQKSIILYCLCICIFFAVFYLYHFSLKAIIYPSLICVILSLLFFAGDYITTLKKHKELTKINSLSAELIDELPKIDGVLENDYQIIIKSLIDEHTELKTDMLKSFNDIIDYYTIWTHQIKTPIASMRLNLQNESGTDIGLLKEDLQRIEQYTEMAMMYLRLDSNSTDYVIKEYSIDKIIKAAVRKLSSQFIRKKIRLVYDGISKSVLTDEKWLSFVVEQILSNALKYTNSGEIEISLDRSNVLCIRDTGIGIATEDIPRIFEKGYTGYNGRKDKRASGIGMYLCKRICSNLGHKISVKSKVNCGTSVYIDLSRIELNTAD